MLRNRQGFTLIELLIVVVIIGILAAIAIPKFGKSREKAYVSAMQSDLRQIMTAQEIYYSDPNNAYVYADDIDDLSVNPSAGVTITIAAGDADGWAASATHDGTAAWTCSVYVGESHAGDVDADEEGVIQCVES